MPLRRKATLAILYARASTRLRATVAAGAAISATAKLLPIFIALKIAGGDARGATATGVAGILALAGGRVVSSGARVVAECDLRRAIAHALLESDVLVDPTPQPSRSLAEPIFHARTLISETVPELGASVVAAVVVAPLLMTRLPGRALVVSGVAMGIVMVALVLLSRVTSELQRRVWKAHTGVLELAAFAIEGRLELVARGAENAAMRSLDGAIDRYRDVARRGALGSVLLGRAPLAAGLAAVAVVLVVDTSSREAVTSTVLAQALVLAACLPIVLGVVMRANEVVRYSAMVGPVLDVLGAPRRPELARAGDAPPPLPATIVARDLTFSYDADDPPTLQAVSFEWRPGTALLLEGANGAGKSTLLRLVLGLRVAQSGSLTVGGADLASLDLPAFRRGIAYLPQRPYLGEAYSTVRSALRAIDDDIPDPTLLDALTRVGLGSALSGRHVEALEVRVGELSAGQRQRLALARVLVQKATVYVLDEPDANLDRAGVHLVGEIVADLLAQGRMVAIAAHSDELTSLAGTHVRLRG